MAAATRALKRASFEVFRNMDRVGIHVLPKHFYTPVQDHKWLTENLPLWARRVDLTGVDWDLDEQLKWTCEVCTPYYHEVQGLSVFRAATGYGLGYGEIESQVLHCVIRHYKPPRIIEVGSGVSTFCTQYACELNEMREGAPSAMTCIEPYPNHKLLSLRPIKILSKMLQELDLSIFRQLDAGDLLFIDSSHAVKTGSDVLVLYLELIPILKPGVLIHIHDITLPYTYCRDSLENYFDWQETALLLALLKGNPHLKILSCLSALHYDRCAALATILLDYRPQDESGPGLAPRAAPGHFPASTWLMTA